MIRSTGETQPRSGPVSWVVVLAILGGAMITAEILSGSMMPLMATGLNTSEGMIGQAVTASAIVAIITSLSINKIAGMHDRRTIMVVLSLLLMASNIGVALAPNVWVMLLARLLLGAAIGIVWGLIPAAVLRLAPKGQFARAFAQVSIGVAGSGVIAAPLAAYFGALLSWRVVYAAAAVLAAIAAVLLQFSFPSLPASTDTRDRNLKSTLRLPGLIAGMVGVMLMFGGMQVFFGYLVPFLETVTRLSPTLVSVVLLLYGLSGLIGNLAAPRSLAISIPGTMMASTAIMAVLLAVLLPIGHLFVPTLIALMAWAFARMHVGVGVNSWVAHNFPEHVEQTSGILVAVIQFSMMIGAIIGGALIDTLGAKAPATAAMLILGTGAVYISVAMKPAPSSNDPQREVLPTIAETQNIDASSGTFG